MASNIGNHEVAHGGLYINGNLVGITLSDSRHGYFTQSTVRALVHVNAGDRVTIKNTDSFDANYYDGSGSPYSTFSEAVC
jgi:hypothetical protein